jgi:S1-C subfamily serine protease
MSYRKAVAMLCFAIYFLWALPEQLFAGGSACTYSKAQGDHEGNFCSDSQCSQSCGLARMTAQSLLDPRVTGIFERLDSEGYVVDLIAPHSPAERAGIREGDRIRSVDGVALPLTGVSHGTWASGTDHIFQIVRQGQTLTVPVPTEGLRNVLISAVYGSDHSSASLAEAVQFVVPLRPFITGLNVENIGGTLTVTTVLPGSPSESAGIRPGDVIAKAPPETSMAEILNSIEGADSRDQIALEILRMGQRTSYVLNVASVSELLRDTAVAKLKTGMRFTDATSF